MTNESENALPLNEEFWKHTDHLDFDMVIKLSEDKYINILTALHDVYEAIDRDPEEAKFLATSIAGLLLSSKYGKTDEVYEEMVVQAAKKNMDQGLKELLSEKP